MNNGTIYDNRGFLKELSASDLMTIATAKEVKEREAALIEAEKAQELAKEKYLLLIGENRIAESEEVYKEIEKGFERLPRLWRNYTFALHCDVYVKTYIKPEERA